MQENNSNKTHIDDILTNDKCKENNADDITNM